MINLEIPAYWKWVTLDEISNKITDGSHNPPKGVEVGIPMLSARNIQNNLIDFSDIRYLSNEDFEIENQRTDLKPFDILLTTVGTIGRAALVPYNSKFVLQRSVTVIKPLINSKYLLYYLQSSQFQKELIDNSTGTAQKGIYLSVLKKLKIPLASTEEQNRIVERIDELYSELDKSLNEIIIAVNKIKLQKISVVKKYLHKEFVNTKRLEEIVEITSSKRIFKAEYREKGIPFYRIKEIVELSKDYTIQSKIFISKDRYDEVKTKYGVPKKNDILLTAIGTIGEMYIVSNDNPFYFKDGNILWLKVNKQVNPHFLKLCIQKEIHDIKSFSGSTYEALNIEKLKSIKVPFPEIKIQKEISTLIEENLSNLRNLEGDLEKQIGKISLMRQKILQEAFQGKLTDYIESDIGVDILLKEIIKEKEQYLLNQQKIMKNRPRIKRMEKEKLSIIQVLERNKNPISAKQLWEESMYSDSIEKFYSELKKVQDKIFEEKSVKGSLIKLK